MEAQPEQSANAQTGVLRLIRGILKKGFDTE